ncbi:MAG: hypothetical protein J6Y20_03520 [Lachnospiraceae bacterium]|nr:hypothetical protein [Lachnospiraceae bacterium]
MDVTLERILSLLPHNEAGRIIHGARQEFAQSIGLKSGNLISDWVKGRSKSYEDYIYQIAAKYNVSVEWLRGETDERRPGVNSFDQAVLDFVHQLPPDKLRGILLLLGAPKELLDALDREGPQG